MVRGFPGNDETKGEVYFGFRSTKHITEDILFLEASLHFVGAVTGNNDSLLSTATGYTTYDYIHPAFVFFFMSVPTNRTGEVLPRFREVIKQIISDGLSDSDLSKIKTGIDSKRVWTHIKNENNFHQEFFKPTILDLLYSTQKEHFKKFVTVKNLLLSKVCYCQKFVTVKN